MSDKIERVSLINPLQANARFYTPRKCQKARYFLAFSRSEKMEHWFEMG